MNDTARGTILILDDEPDQLKLYNAQLKGRGLRVLNATSLEEAIARIREFTCDLILLDKKWNEDVTFGLDMLKELKQRAETKCVPVVILTAHQDDASRTLAEELGAADYLTKAATTKELGQLVDRALTNAKLRAENSGLRKEKAALQEVLLHSIRKAVPGISDAMQNFHKETLRLVRDIYFLDPPPSVFLIGETGTGKGMVVDMLRALPKYRDMEHVTMNMAALPANLQEDELFGRLPGTLGVSDKGRVGAFEKAGRGVLFLDEISSASLDVQAKLLRVCEKRKYKPVGTAVERNVDALMVVASDEREFEKRKAKEEFMPSLEQRLRERVLKLPPLRCRNGDVAHLGRSFLVTTARRESLTGEAFEIESDAWHPLEGYDWPRNVRQLRDVIRDAAIIAETSGTRMITAHHVKEALNRSISELGDTRTYSASESRLPIASAQLTHEDNDVLRGQDVNVLPRLQEVWEHCFRECQRPPQTDNRKGWFATFYKDFRRQFVQALVEDAGGNKSRVADWLGTDPPRVDGWLKKRRDADDVGRNQGSSQPS